MRIFSAAFLRISRNSGSTEANASSISAWVTYVFCDFSVVFKGETWGLIPVLVMLVSAVLMVIVGLAARKKGLGWLNDYALPISLIGGMASAIPITAWLG